MRYKAFLLGAPTDTTGGGVHTYKSRRAVEKLVVRKGCHENSGIIKKRIVWLNKLMEL
jgi:hypothetical protein